jgi:hypothetical protein
MRRLRSGRTDRYGEKNRHTHIAHNGRDNSIRKLAMRQPDADEAGPRHLTTTTNAGWFCLTSP